MGDRPRRPKSNLSWNRYDSSASLDESDNSGARQNGSHSNKRRPSFDGRNGVLVNKKGRGARQEAGNATPRYGGSRENLAFRGPDSEHSAIPDETKRLILNLGAGNRSRSQVARAGQGSSQGEWQDAPSRRGRGGRRGDGRQNFGSSMSLSDVSETSGGGKRNYAPPRQNKGYGKNNWSNRSVNVTKLETVDDWNTLASFDNSMRILFKLQEFESSWVKAFQSDASFELLDVAFGLFNRIDMKYRFGRLALMKSLFTVQFIERIVLLLEQCKRQWLARGVNKIVSFVKQLRYNIEFILSNDATFHELETSKTSIEQLIDACVVTLTHINVVLVQQGCPDESIDKEVAMVRELLQIKFVEMMVLDEPLHPEDFLKPFDVMPNIVNGAYESDDHYVQTHFGLLKEDFQSTLRNGVEQYRLDPKKKNFDIWAYEDVEVKRFFPPPTLSTNTRFDTNKVLFKLTFPKCTYFTKINWKFVKRFMFGSLVVLTADKFQTNHLALVEERDFENPNNINILVSFIFSPPNAVEDTKFVLVEPKVFYEPYLNSMKVLVHMAKIGLPMKKYIVRADTSPALPAYLTPDTSYHIGPHVVKVANVLSWPKAEEMGLNRSQREAFFTALTSEMALIQGPPGTGKTYLAFKIIDTLLANRISSYADGPIMIVCYKNHSLDQILEGLIDRGRRVVRIGSQSKCKALKYDYNVNRLPAPPTISSLKTEKSQLEYKLQKNLKRIKWIVAAVKLINARIGIIDLSLLKKYNVVPEELDLDLATWLLELLEDAPEMSMQDIVDKCHSISCNQSFLQIAESLEALQFFFCENLQEIGKCFLQTNSELASFSNKQYWSPEEFDMYYQLEGRCWFEFTKFTHLHYGLSSEVDPTYCPTVDSVDLEHYFSLDLDERWALYDSWEASLIQQLENRLFDLQNEVREIEENLLEYKELVLSQTLKYERPLVIGVTTSGASKHYSALADVGAKVVLVEEAAEVLEAHVIASLSTKCEHLILIGDHQQLKPSTASHMLGDQYRMNVSLFERMIKNDIKWSCLSTQHRMRPEIAALISPSIYRNLVNHDSVLRYPNVIGTKKNVYFFTHSNPEQVGYDSESKFNPKEGEMLLAICNYLVRQGYKPSDITILSTYLEQDRFMKKTIERTYSPNLREVNCTVVDNYQGEENIIILLSLVRSNQFGDVGFLSIKNRVCVALSRAKHGLFIFGNMPCLSKKERSIWTEINEVLLGQEAIGPRFPLKCTRHGNVTEVGSPQDISALSHAGCSNPCDAPLPCGHTCRIMCHGQDQEHRYEFMCREKCMKRCSDGHVCPAPCRVSCPPCPQLVPKLLICGHSRQLECHKANLQSNCQETVEIKLDLCGHNQFVPCRLTEQSERYKIICKAVCNHLFNCGHTCKKTCHKKTEPDHTVKNVCQEPCELINKSCPRKHRCQKKCREPCGDCMVKVEKTLPCEHKAQMKCCHDVSDYICNKKCNRKLPCDHDCDKKCSEPCGPCIVPVEKTIEECGHKMIFKCSAVVTRSHCMKPCETWRSCGHQCPGLCKQICDEQFCPTMVDVELACGHQAQLACSTSEKRKSVSLTICKAPCQAALPCGHRCKGTCGECLQGRVHVMCNEMCEKSLVCGHKCKNRCNHLVHTCPFGNCFPKCWQKELKSSAPVKSKKKGKKRMEQAQNQNPVQQLIYSIRNALNSQVAQMGNDARHCRSNQTISSQFQKIHQFVRNCRLNPAKDDRVEISNLKTRLFKVEFMCVVSQTYKLLGGIALADSDRFELETLMEELTQRVAGDERLSPHEMTQFQEQMMWLRTVLEIHLIGNSLKGAGHAELLANMLTRLNKAKLSFDSSLRKEMSKIVNQCKFQLGLTEAHTVGVCPGELFPLSSQWCQPIHHHQHEQPKSTKEKDTTEETGMISKGQNPRDSHSEITARCGLLAQTRHQQPANDEPGTKDVTTSGTPNRHYGGVISTRGQLPANEGLNSPKPPIKKAENTIGPGRNKFSAVRVEAMDTTSETEALDRFLSISTREDESAGARAANWGPILQSALNPESMTEIMSMSHDIQDLSLGSVLDVSHPASNPPTPPPRVDSFQIETESSQILMDGID